MEDEPLPPASEDDTGHPETLDEEYNRKIAELEGKIAERDSELEELKASGLSTEQQLERKLAQAHEENAALKRKNEARELEYAREKILKEFPDVKSHWISGTPAEMRAKAEEMQKVFNEAKKKEPAPNPAPNTPDASAFDRVPGTSPNYQTANTTEEAKKQQERAGRRTKIAESGPTDESRLAEAMLNEKIFY